MKHGYAVIRRTVLFGLTAIFLISPTASPVQAGIACVSTLPITDGSADNIGFEIKLVGRSLVWFKTSGELFHYNLRTSETRQLGLMQIANQHNELHFAADKKHVVWVDPNSHLQLYNIATGTTTQITQNDRLRIAPSVEGNYVVWRQGKTNDQRKTLMVYDMAAGTTTRIGRAGQYSLNQGRVLWQGNLLDLATGTRTFLGEDYLSVLYGDFALGLHRVQSELYPDFQIPLLTLRNLKTGSLTQLSLDYYRAGLDDEFTIDGDYVGYTVTASPIESRTFHLYQISTGTEQVLSGSPVFQRAAGFVISGRFLGWNNRHPSGINRFFVYDRITGIESPMVYNPAATSERGVINKGRIAWVEYQVNANQGKHHTQVILRVDCGTDPSITRRTPNINILSGRSALLKITTAGDQPIIYRWYKGAPGDTTQPVGENKPSFTTPPLSVSTTYWVRAVNYFGMVDSQPITITPVEVAELVTAGGFEQGLYESWKADGWSSRMCNEEGEAPIAHSGQCALQMSAFFLSKVVQTLPQVPFMPGDTLTLSAWMRGQKVFVEEARMMVKVHYADGTRAKTVINPVGRPSEYTLFTSDPLIITAEVTKVQVVISYTIDGGSKRDWWVDDVSVLHQSGEVSRVIPLPDMPAQTAN